jgi:hypothetical protein
LTTFQWLFFNKKKSMMRKIIDSLRRTRNLVPIGRKFTKLQLIKFFSNFLILLSTVMGASFFSDHKSQFVRFVLTQTSLRGSGGLKIAWNVTLSFFSDCVSQFLMFVLRRTGLWGLYRLKIAQNVTLSFFSYRVRIGLW